MSSAAGRNYPGRDAPIIQQVYGGEPPNEAYLEHLAEVRQLHAPRDELRGRKGDLAKIDAFCAGRDGYLWIQAESWAGKTALLGHWVKTRYRRPDLWVVSCFIEQRRKARSTREDVLKLLIRQLEALLLKPSQPAPLSSGRYFHLREEAAEVCDGREGRRRLVLVLDGLDAASATERDAILELVDAPLPDHVSVIVASRPPGEGTPFLPSRHPLHDRRCVYPLAPSEHAQDIKLRAMEELENLTNAGDQQQAIVGFLTVARGGLSIPDLDQLLSMAPGGSPGPISIKGVLEGPHARSFLCTTNGNKVCEEPEKTRHLLRHDELLEQAKKYPLGEKLPGFQAILDEWAAGYERRGWPPGTPSYVLHDYASLLLGVDNGAWLRLACDARRHQVVLARPDGWAQRSAELSGACSMLAGRVRDDPRQDDVLFQLAHVAGIRYDLGRRQPPYPGRLPVVFAALGHVSHGASLARAVIGASGRVRALAGVVTVAAQHPGAPRVAGEAMSAFQELNPDQDLNPDQRAYIAPDLAEALTTVGRHEEAMKLAEGLDRSRADDVMRSIVRGLARSGRYEKALELARAARLDAVAKMLRTVAHAELQVPQMALQVAASIEHPGQCAYAMADLAGEFAVRGDHLSVLDATRQCANVAPAHDRVRQHQVEALTVAVQTLIVSGSAAHAAEAERLARQALGIATSIWQPQHRKTAMAKAAEALWAAGLSDEALAAATGVDDLDRRARALVAMVSQPGRPDLATVEHLIAEVERVIGQLEAQEALARKADLAVALTNLVPGEAAHLARAVFHDATRAGLQESVTTPVATVLLLTSALDSAHEVIRASSNPCEAAAQVAERLASMRRPSDAQAVAGLLPDGAGQAQVFTMLAEDALARGETDRAHNLARAAERAVLSHSAGDERDLRESAEEALALSQFGLALELAAGLVEPERGMFRRRVANVLRETDPGWARRVAEKTEQPYYRAWALADLLTAGQDMSPAAVEELISAGERALDEVEPPYRLKVCTQLLEAVSAVDKSWALRLLTQASSLVEGSGPDRKTLMKLVLLCWRLASANDAIRLVDQRDDHYERALLLSALVEAEPTAEYDVRDLVNEARGIADQLNDPLQRARILIKLAEALARAGLGRDASRLSRAAGQHRDLTPEQATQVKSLQAVFHASTGDLIHSRVFALQMADPWREATLRDAAIAAARHSKLDEAEQIASELTQPGHRAAALRSSFDQALSAGPGQDPRAERIAIDMIELDRGACLAELADALARRAGPQDMCKARILAAEALTAGTWLKSLPALAALSPAAAAELAVARAGFFKRKTKTTRAKSHDLT